jgi:hypothetical protein
MVNDKFLNAPPYGFEMVDTADRENESASIENFRTDQIGQFFRKSSAN